jgi:fatty-acyl-CoA synthase
VPLWQDRRQEEVVPMLAIDAGPVDMPILDETIGANLARTVAAHGDGEALVSVHQSVRWT